MISRDINQDIPRDINQGIPPLLALERLLSLSYWHPRAPDSSEVARFDRLVSDYPHSVHNERTSLPCIFIPDFSGVKLSGASSLEWCRMLLAQDLLKGGANSTCCQTLHTKTDESISFAGSAQEWGESKLCDARSETHAPPRGSVQGPPNLKKIDI